MTGLEIYLIFNGDCRAAFEYYKQTFGKDYSYLMTYKEMPGDYNIAEKDKDKIAHVSLPIGQSMLMGSDVPHDQPVTAGNNYCINFYTDSREEAERVLERVHTNVASKMIANKINPEKIVSSLS